MLGQDSGESRGADANITRKVSAKVNSLAMHALHVETHSSSPQKPCLIQGIAQRVNRVRLQKHMTDTTKLNNEPNKLNVSEKWTI